PRPPPRDLEPRPVPLVGALLDIHADLVAESLAGDRGHEREQVLGGQGPGLGELDGRGGPGGPGGGLGRRGGERVPRAAEVADVRARLERHQSVTPIHMPTAHAAMATRVATGPLSPTDRASSGSDRPPVASSRICRFVVFAFTLLLPSGLEVWRAPPVAPAPTAPASGGGR